MARLRMYCGVFAIAALVIATTAQAASVIDQVPRDSLGFVLVRNLSQADAKLGKAAGALRVAIPTPLTMLKAMTAVGAGVDLERDLLLVMLPPENSSRPFHLAVWLPVKDYDALVHSLDGDPQRRIAPATIAGEDVLIAHVADWAVIMDPDQRDRLNQMASGEASAKQPAADTARFIDPDNDISLVVLPPGMQTAGSWLASESAMKPSTSDVATDDHGQHGKIVPLQPEPTNDNSWRAVWQSVESMLSDAQELKRVAMEARGCGCGLRLDDTGNAVLKFRVALSPDFATVVDGSDSTQRTASSAPRLYDDGPFVINASGVTSRRWLLPMVGPYVRQTASDLATQFNAKLDDADVCLFRQAAEQAVAEVRAASILTRPGTEQDGVFTYNFLAVRVASADEFVGKVEVIVKQWNAMLGKSDESAGLALEEAAVKVADHVGIEYSIDMAKAVGGPAMPEMRQTMERLYGPGGVLRAQIVKVDDATVLLAMATEDQLIKPIQTLVPKPSEPANDGEEIKLASQLLTGDSDWQLYFSLDNYNHWLKRQMEAIVGPVIGGPIVRPFPESPPIGAAGGAAQNMVWAEVAVPADTLRGFGQFLHP